MFAWIKEQQALLIAAAVIAAMLTFVILVAPSLADSADEDPALTDFYSSLKQPDLPAMSCCGSGDAYYADQVETDAIGNLVAIITDTRPDARQLANGRTIRRIPIPPGTKFIVPDRKRRAKVAVPNPSGHNIIFIGPPNEFDLNGYKVYCWEPAAGG